MGNSGKNISFLKTLQMATVVQKQCIMLRCIFSWFIILYHSIAQIVRLSVLFIAFMKQISDKL